MFSIRARTLSGWSSFLDCSFLFSGSRYPSAHWPSALPLRGLRGAGRTGASSVVSFSGVVSAYDSSGVVAPSLDGALVIGGASSGAQDARVRTTAARTPADDRGGGARGGGQ